MKDFKAFDTKKIDDYAREAKAAWGETPEWQEYEQKTQDRTRAQRDEIARGLMDVFREFGAIRDQDPASEEAQALVTKLQGYISEHYYTCSDQVLLGLSHMYDGGGEMTENIDEAGGPGTGAFAAKAIRVRCRA